MKQRVITTSFAVLFSITLFSQNFISSGKQWDVLFSFYSGFSTEIFKIEGDSTVNSIFYNKIWISDDSMVTWNFRGLLREESNVVYYIPPDMSEGVLYDFNAEVGDTLKVKNLLCSDTEIPVTIINIDTVEYLGTPRKRWQLDSDMGAMDEYWVEGIGSLNGPLYTKFWYCMACPAWELLCFHENDTLKYILSSETGCYKSTVGVTDNKESIDFTIKPNPVKNGSVIHIEISSTPKSISIYNSAGVFIRSINLLNKNKIAISTNGLSRGIYFINVITKENIIKTQKVVVE